MPKKTVKLIGSAFKGLSELAKLKAELGLLAQYSSDTVYRLRYDTMQYDYISPSVKRLLGFTPEELAETGLRSLIIETRIINEGMRQVESYAPLEETRKRGEVRNWQADYLMRSRSGNEVWVSDISYPWFDENGAIIGSIGSLRDITERITAEQKHREELLRSTQNDLLTGLSSRPTFWGRLEDETRRLKRTHGDLSLLLVDIDRFRAVNESYGEEMGDMVLKEIAQLVMQSMREIDCAGRLSGEEFGLILPETPMAGALKVATRLRDTIARHTFFAGSNTIPVGCTVSIGVASTRFGQNIDASQLYKLADMRLFIAQHSGDGQISADEHAGSLH